MKAEKKNIWYTVAAVVVGGVFFVGAKQLTSGGIATAQRALTPTAEVEAMLERFVANDPMYAALAENFPTEWATMRGELAADVKSDISMGELNARAHARSRAFMLERASATASAPTSALVRLLAAEADFISQLQRENVRYCADFGMRGLQPGTQLSPAMMQKLSLAGRARVIATRQGLDSPQRRDPSTDGDWALVGTTMEANGVPEATLEAIGNPAAASPEVQCEGTVQFYRALNELPPEQGAKLFGEITVEAAKTAR